MRIEKQKNCFSLFFQQSQARPYRLSLRQEVQSRVELSYSANTQLPTQKFHRGEIVYANNSEDVLWFKKGNYRYTVYSPTRGSPGLSVALNGDVITRLECNNSGGGTTDSPKTSSPFIVEHGTADLMPFEESWKD